ncbi:DUF6192 family protein [Streptomyces sp. BK208]|uniref:DUF6192 family protein n=1 Tax=Streptomyces sp. BK208 TaxID=2512150 RepID=UPI00326392E8
MIAGSDEGETVRRQIGRVRAAADSLEEASTTASFPLDEQLVQLLERLLLARGGAGPARGRRPLQPSGRAEEARSVLRHRRQALRLVRRR